MEEELGPSEMQYGHVFIACKLEGSTFQHAVSSLASAGCHGLYQHGTTDDTRAALLQEFILELRLNADDVAYMFNSKFGIDTVALNSMSRLRQQNSSSFHTFSMKPGGSSVKTYHFHTIKSHPIGGPVEMFSPCSLLSSNVNINVMSPQPKYGEHTVDILRDMLGYTNDEISNMEKQEIIGKQWSNHYIPDGGTNLNPWNNVKTEYDQMMEDVKQLRLVDDTTVVPKSSKL